MDAFFYPLLMLIAVALFVGFTKKLKGSSSADKTDDSSLFCYQKKGPLITPAIESHNMADSLKAEDASVPVDRVGGQLPNIS